MKVIAPGSVIGIIGGGQLGRMAAVAASALGYKVHILTDTKNSPASFVAAKTFVGPYEDKKLLEKFAHSVDVVSYEFENIPIESVEYLAELVEVRPNPKCLKVAQHRVVEKDFMKEIGVPTANYRHVKNAQSCSKAFKEIGPHCILKTAQLGYDGKGQHKIDENTVFAKLWREHELGDCILEELVPFEKEISVVLARDIHGGAMPYMPSQNIHNNGILDTTIAPADIPEGMDEKAWDIAFNIADSLELVGVLAVEFFVTKDGELLVNEIAPRPHNSGHWTMDACVTGQFEQFVRAICGLPLGSSAIYCTAIMKNLIGDDVNLWEEYIKEPDAKLHLYGKDEAKEGRKMGHVTLLMSADDELVEV